jgi:hypothetical protein
LQLNRYCGANFCTISITTGEAAQAVGHETFSRPSPQPTPTACEPSNADEYEKLAMCDGIG